MYDNKKRLISLIASSLLAIFRKIWQGYCDSADPPEKCHVVEIESTSQAGSKSLTFVSTSPDFTSTVYAKPFDFLIKQNRS